MEKRELIIAGVAAAVASGCIRCLENARQKALSSGLNQSDLLEIADLAFKIRGHADDFNRKDLDLVLNGKQESSASGYQCCQA